MQAGKTLKICSVCTFPSTPACGRGGIIYGHYGTALIFKGLHVFLHQELQVFKVSYRDFHELTNLLKSKGKKNLLFHGLKRT